MSVDYVWVPALVRSRHICDGCAFNSDTGDSSGCISRPMVVTSPCADPDVVAIPKDEVDAWIVRRTLHRMGITT